MNITHSLVLLRTVLPCLLLPVLVSCSKNDRPANLRARPLTNRVFEKSAERVARGKYLTEGPLHCFLCHSERAWDLPGAPPRAETAGGGRIFIKDSTHLLATPNITPDTETGAGKWTDDMLARAIREGVGNDGRALYPLMQYRAFRNLCDEDLASIVVYLRSIPAVRNPLPRRLLPPVEEESLVNGPEPIYQPVLPRDLSGPVKRGKYLLDIAGCVGCHSAWNGPFMPGLYAGGNLIKSNSVGISEHSFSANITSDPSGIPYYDDSLFIEVMRFGRVRVRKLSPLMPWISFQHMNEDDLRAIFAYLKTLKPVRHVVNNQDSLTYCTMCGQEHGEGEYNVSKFETFTPVSVDESLYDQFSGRYEGENFKISFMRKGGEFVAQGDWRARRAGRAWGEMRFIAGPDSLFYAKEWPAPVSFERDNRGIVVGLISHETDSFIARKIN